MKTITLISSLLVSNIFLCQFQSIPLSPNNSFRTLGGGTPVGAVGIGYFPNTTALPSALTINSNLLPAPSGETFRTTAPAGSSSWRMELGTGAFAQKFRITANANNTELGSVQNGTFSLFTNSLYRFMIDNGATGVNQGRVAIGNNLLPGFTILDRLHLHQDASSDVRMRFTHSGVTAGSTIGINNLGEFHLTQFEQQPMLFYTDLASGTLNNRERLRITEDDRIFSFLNNTLATAANMPVYNSKFNIHDRNTDNLMLFRVVGLGQKVNGSPALIPIGALNQNYTLAEIIQKSLNAGDAGLRIQGSRQNCFSCDIGFVDFANYDNLPQPILYNMSRVASGIHDRDSSISYIRFYTNNGTDPLRAVQDNGLLERMRINGYGIGFFNMIPENIG